MKNNFSAEAFANFQNKLENPIQICNGNLSFQGKVMYTWDENRVHEILNVTLFCLGEECGKVKIEEGNILQNKIVHMEFNPVYQNYNINAENCLIITGCSLKLGYYSVKITEM